VKFADGEAEQILVVGGHLDSWDLGKARPTMVRDGDGVGAAEASRIRASGRGAHSLRAVTGEEQGLDGSLPHQAAPVGDGDHLGNLVLDAGQGAVKGFQMGGRETVEVFQPFADSLAISINDGDDKVNRGRTRCRFSMAGLPGSTCSGNG